MKIDIPGVVADAWTLFRRHQPVLMPIAGLFLFLPTLWLLLFVPDAPQLPPPDATDAQIKADAELISAWIVDNGSAFFAAAVVALYGLNAVCAYFLDRESADVGAALVSALRALPRLVLASLIIVLPASIGLLALALPGLYVLGRTMLVAPVLIAEPRQSAISAIRQSIFLTRGNGLVLAAVTGLGMLAGQILPTPFEELSRQLAAMHAGNAVVIFLLSALAAAAASIAALALMLVRVTVYRRLALINGI